MSENKMNIKFTKTMILIWYNVSYILSKFIAVTIALFCNDSNDFEYLYVYIFVRIN